MPERVRRRLAGLLVLALLSCRPDRPVPPPAPPRPVERVTLVAVGDIIMHADVKKSAVQQGGFDPMWRELDPLFRSADLVFGNLETPVAPTSGQPGEPFVFNAPEDLPEALARGGFTVLSTANNHAYDQGPQGVEETCARLEAAGLVAVGSGRGRAQALAPRVLERHGFRIAFLAWTDLFNRGFNQARGPWVARLDADQACEAVRQARSLADVVVVSVHWGQEDEHEPTPRQRDVARRLQEAGADLILGHHPHVLQPLEVSGTAGHRTAVAYSLGNFLSNQDRFYDADRMPTPQGDARDGAAVMATFTRTDAGHAGLETLRYTPLWTENNWREVNGDDAAPREIRVVRLDDPGRQVQPWLRRRERIREVLGRGFERP